MGCSRSDNSGADSPEEAVKKLEAAYRTGNFDDYLGILIKEERDDMLKLKQVVNANERASAAFYDALDLQFGNDPPIPRPATINLQQMIHQPGLQLQIVSSVEKKPGQLELRVKRLDPSNPLVENRETEVILSAIKEDGSWKLGQGLGLSERGCAYFESRTKAYQQVTELVKAGKIRDRLTALKMWREKSDALLAKKDSH
jgi:hypothetical protein